MAEKPNCLRDCQALCCIYPMMIFYFIGEEENRMRMLGAVLSEEKGGYRMEACPLLNGNECLAHNTDLQPSCCKNNKVGGDRCLRIRKYYIEGGWRNGVA